MIAVIDSGVGNIRSVVNALEYLKTEYKIVTSHRDLVSAKKIIFPGVGAFADGMKALAKSKLLPALREAVLKKKKPFLGICLGMQLLAREGYENGKHKGLNFIAGTVRLINVSGLNLKLPHIGWNNVYPKKNVVLFTNLGKDPTFYFVHSYVLQPENKNIITAYCQYGEKFAASIQYKNIFGTQFHPEKSQQNGLKLLANFVRMV